MAKITSTYIRTLQAGDFTASGTTIALVNTTYTEVATFRVPAKQRVAIGNGRINLGVDDRGSYSINISTSAPANIPGVARLTLKDANKVINRFIREDLSADILAGTTSKRVGVGGYTGNGEVLTVGEDEYIALEYKSTAASATATYANCTINLPVTINTLTSN